MTELERELLEALKEALMPVEMYRAYGWADRAGVINKIKRAIARAEAKAKQPVCKCDPDTWNIPPLKICGSFLNDGAGACITCEHDKDCHIVGGEG